MQIVFYLLLLYHNFPELSSKQWIWLPILFPCHFILVPTLGDWSGQDGATGPKLLASYTCASRHLPKEGNFQTAISRWVWRAGTANIHMHTYYPRIYDLCNIFLLEKDLLKTPRDYLKFYFKKPNHFASCTLSRHLFPTEPFIYFIPALWLDLLTVLFAERTTLSFLISLMLCVCVC